MFDFSVITADLAWPITLLAAWFLGEFGRRHAGLPRISIYAIIGFASSSIGLVPPAPSDAMLLLANIAFGLILFESGHRINLHWLRINPWLGITSLTEAGITFGAVYGVSRWFDIPATTAVLLAALSMATSPATIMRVISEQKSSGQVTERTLHLSVLNCVLAVFVFKMVVGLVVFQTSGNPWQAAYSSLIALIASALLGGLFGSFIPAVLRNIQPSQQDSTLAFAIAVVMLVALTHGLKLSPVLATLTFGLVARHRRIVLSSSQRGFGALGDLLSLLLFVFVASTLEWHRVLAGMGIGMAIILVRLLAKLLGVGLFSHLSGISWRKGLSIGIAISPISTFVILVLEQTRHLGIGLADQLAPLAAAALTMEILGPVLTQRAMVWAKETSEPREGN